MSVSDLPTDAGAPKLNGEGAVFGAVSAELEAAGGAPKENAGLEGAASSLLPVVVSTGLLGAAPNEKAGVVAFAGSEVDGARVGAGAKEKAGLDASLGGSEAFASSAAGLGAAGGMAKDYKTNQGLVARHLT